MCKLNVRKRPSSSANTVPLPSALSFDSLLQIMKPKLPRRVADSPRINLNKYWIVFENLLSGEDTRFCSVTTPGAAKSSIPIPYVGFPGEKARALVSSQQCK